MESIRENPSPSISLISNIVENSGNYLACKLGRKTCSSCFLLSGVFVQKRNSGRKKFHETRHPTYRGVRQRNGKWVCEMREPHSKSRRLWLGTFTCPDMAARAYDVAAMALKGDSAVLNFPRAVSQQTSPSSSTATRDTAASSESSHYSVSPSNESTAASEVAAVEAKKETLEKVYLDEEEIFNMPGLISSLAEGLMLPPPVMHYGFDCLEDDDILGSMEDFRLSSD